MSEFLMPSLGADMESAVLMEWLVKEGDTVKKGDVIAEVETSKGVIEIEVFEDGVVEKILVEPETECRVGSPLAVIRSKDAAEAKPSEASEVEKETVTAETREKVPEEGEQTEKIIPEPTEERIKVSPAARKKAKEMGIDLSEVPLNKAAQIHLSQLDSYKPTPIQNPSKDGMRKAIAAAMSRSNAEIPHYYLQTSINMSPALKWLEALNRERGIEKRILPAALIIHAIVKALKEAPELNGFWKEDAQQLSKAIHPGIAISLRKGGLITPALLNAHDMDLEETMDALGDLITRTRAGKLRNSEISQQTITITNLGDLGVESVYGVIYPPQLAIVGLGRIMDTPWAEGDTLSVRKVLQATLGGDHRATDGHTGALLLEKLDQFLQNPQEFLWKKKK